MPQTSDVSHELNEANENTRAVLRVVEGIYRAASVKDAIQIALDTVRSAFGWEYASFWTVDQKEKVLRFTSESGTVNEEFRRVTREARFREGEGVAAKVLENLNVELAKVRQAVEFIIGRGERPVVGEIGLTPRAKKVIELAIDEARRLGHNYIGTEHLLLGLVREEGGIASGVLESLGVNLDKVRHEVIRVLSQSSAAAPVASLRRVDALDFYGLERIAMVLQKVDSVFDLEWAPGVKYADVRHRDEVEQSKYAFNVGVELPAGETFSALHRRLYDNYYMLAESLLGAGLVVPALEHTLKCSHLFNILDASGGIGVTERIGPPGIVVTPLDEQEVREAARTLGAAGVESIALARASEIIARMA